MNNCIDKVLKIHIVCSNRYSLIILRPLPDASIPVEAPSLDEVQRATWRLRNGRAAGADDIPHELLKCAIDPVSRALHGLFCTI